jgi:hypothetical protein
MIQAVKDGSLDTTVYAVDTWEGDENAGFYGPEVYDHVLLMIRNYYREQRVRLLQTTFAQAVYEFEDKSIDVLHIDGLHTYEAVKEDYDTWKSKVSDNGVIMFHDIRVADFGVWKVWEDVKAENPDAAFIEFEHHYGLGVLIKSPELKPLITEEFKKHVVKYYKDAANESVGSMDLIPLEVQRNLLLIESRKLDTLLKECRRHRDELDSYALKLKKENEDALRRVKELQNHIDVLESSYKSVKAQADQFEQFRQRKIYRAYNRLMRSLGKSK